VEDIKRLIINHPLPKYDQHLPLRNLRIELLLQIQQYIQHIPRRLQPNGLLIQHYTAYLTLRHKIVLQHPRQHHPTLILDHLHRLPLTVKMLKQLPQIANPQYPQHFLVELHAQVDLLKQPDEVGDAVLLADLQALREAFDEDLDEGLV
jgi:hypothetical protein